MQFWCLAVAAILAGSTAALAEHAPSADEASPTTVHKLSLSPDDESVYAPPALPSERGGLNEGGVNFGLNVMYLTDYVFRGVDRGEGAGKEDSPNTQFDARVDFNLDRLPHPFIGTFVNVFNSDPISQFQEVRPYFGIDWNIRPLRIEVGHQTFLFPDRDEANTAEVYGKLTIDDSALWGTEEAILSPYLLAAYDYDLNKGWYFEFGISHRFEFEDAGLTITPTARAAYIANQQVFAETVGGEDSGFQHYDIGFTVTYSLTRLLDVSPRYGDWQLTGVLFYTDSIENDLLADTQLWGGIGIGFRY
jgi:hypothetical protein